MKVYVGVEEAGNEEDVEEDVKDNAVHEATTEDNAIHEATTEDNAVHEATTEDNAVREDTTEDNAVHEAATEDIPGIIQSMVLIKIIFLYLIEKNFDFQATLMASLPRGLRPRLMMQIHEGIMR